MMVEDQHLAHQLLHSALLYNDALVDRLVALSFTDLTPLLVGPSLQMLFKAVCFIDFLFSRL